MEPDEIEAFRRLFNSLMSKMAFLRAVSILQECQISVLKSNFVALAVSVGAKSTEDSSIEQALDLKTWELVNNRLAEISDDDPSAATELRKILDTDNSEL